MSVRESITVLRGHLAQAREVLEDVDSGIHQPLIARQTYQHLAELMRFRHFKRPYVEQQYDWDRIDFLTQTYEKVRPLIARDLDAFDRFLVRLARDG